MNRNLDNHFAENPVNIEMQRSKFNRPNMHKTTFNAGDLVPIYVDEVLPGDTVSMDSASAIRMSTPIYPVMDNAYMDYYWFFVPERLTWEHWRNLMGENTESKWAPEVTYQMPQVTAPTGGWIKGTIADYMGVPTKIGGLSIRADFFRAYALIVNEWFRDQNLKDPCYINRDDATQAGSNGGDYQTDVQLGGKPFKAAKAHDYFTSALPEPLKGEDVLIPLGETAPIIGTEPKTLYSTSVLARDVVGKEVNYYRPTSEAGTKALLYTNDNKITGTNSSIGLAADLSAAAAATVNQLRQAFAIQRMLERDARSGTRYREIIRAHFGVTSDDARMQVPEYLGGSRVWINIDQVLQTSSTDTTSPQGNTAAYSLTNSANHDFTKSFTEHGILMCVAVIRTKHTYQQGLERMWSRKDRYDWYWPSLANLGEQAILNKEIYAQGTAADDEAFGYQERWAEYRYKPDRVSGAFRSNYDQPLDSWHYADYYTSQPILGSAWIDETTANINRTLAVQSELEDQFIADFYFNGDWTRAMPLYSVPGLLDHH